MSKKKFVFKIMAFCLLFCAFFFLISTLMQDKWSEGEYDSTNKIKGFYREPENSLDFVFIGSSQLYAHVAPAVLYRDYGMTSYDFAANEQPLWISYYYMKEALKYQNPKAIVLEVFTVYGADLEEEGVNHINLDDLPFSVNKINAIKNAVPEELQLSYVFDLSKYHSTWSTFYEGKWKYTFDKSVNVNKGYSPFLFKKEYRDHASEEVRSVTEKTPIPARAQEWLYKMIELANKEGVDLIFIKTPNGNPERQMLYNSVEEFAGDEKIPFLNLNTILDGEAHVNVLQAEKITQSIGAYLNAMYEDEVFYGTQEAFEHKAAWQECVISFESAKEDCLTLE